MDFYLIIVTTIICDIDINGWRHVVQLRSKINERPSSSQRIILLKMLCEFDTELLLCETIRAAFSYMTLLRKADIS